MRIPDGQKVICIGIGLARRRQMKATITYPCRRISDARSKPGSRSMRIATIRVRSSFQIHLGQRCWQLSEAASKTAGGEGRNQRPDSSGIPTYLIHSHAEPCHRQGYAAPPPPGWATAEREFKLGLSGDPGNAIGHPRLAGAPSEPRRSVVVYPRSLPSAERGSPLAAIRTRPESARPDVREPTPERAGLEVPPCSESVRMTSF